MFTGIIETKGTIVDIVSQGTNKSFWINSPISHNLSVDQSISHDGVCLTVEDVKNGMHKVTAIQETLLKTTLNKWVKEGQVNLERCLQINGRLDGHIVQGHVDTTARCTAAVDKSGSWEYTFDIHKKFAHLIIEKGSIAINGTSLTIFNIGDHDFTVAIIPYTYDHTTIRYIKKDDLANIEFDMMGKYVSRIAEVRNLI